MALLALLWSLALTITGGIAIETGWRLISSRNAVRPLVAGLVLVAWYVAVWRRHWREDLGRYSTPAPWPRFLASLAILVALIVGFGWGTRIAAGPDQSGYVSQAAMFARGEITVPAPAWSRNAPWDDAAFSASPVGWAPTHQTHILAPIYSPGLPLIMAAFERAAGPGAVFYVVPILGAVLVWSTYLLGSRLDGPWVGAIAAVLVASSPTFLLMQQQAMSDVPVSAFLTLSIALALGGSSILAGLSAAIVVLIRPNLVPLVVFPLALLLLRLGGRRQVTLRGHALWHAFLFAIPVGVAATVIAALNWRYHGSPLLSGYGPLSAYYSIEGIGTNLRQYSRWFVEGHTPIALAGMGAVLAAGSDRARRLAIALVTLGLPLSLLAIYMPYMVFHDYDWGSLRFLLPGYPGLFAGFGILVTSIVIRARHRVRAAWVGVALVGFVSAWGWTYAVRSGVFMQRVGDARYARAVEYARQLPRRSVILSNAHSGTLRFYTGVDVLRFEAIRPWEVDTAVAHLRRLGYALFFLGDEFELEQFRTRFAGTHTLAALGAKPRDAFDGVVVYDVR